MQSVIKLVAGSIVVSALILGGCAGDGDSPSEPDIATTTNSTTPGAANPEVSANSTVQQDQVPLLVRTPNVRDTHEDLASDRYHGIGPVDPPPNWH